MTDLELIQALEVRLDSIKRAAFRLERDIESYKANIKPLQDSYDVKKSEEWTLQRTIDVLKSMSETLGSA